MFRFGCALQLRPQHSDQPSQLYARCAVACQHGLSVVRIPPALASPLPAHATPYVREYVQQHRLRLVVHAPFAHISQLIPDMSTWVSFFTQLDCTDAVIICHVPQLDAPTATLLRSLDPTIRHYLALEHTHHAPDRFGAFTAQVGIPPIFDWQHYHHAAPWPYTPDRTLCEWAARWVTRRPLWHMSSASAHGSPTQHGTVVDSSMVIWLLRSLRTSGHVCDIEIESPAGIAAWTRLRHEIQHKAPELIPFIQNGDTNADTQ